MFSIRDAALLGLVREREAYQQIGDETERRKAAAAREVILGCSSELWFLSLLCSC